jgi:C4-dicarboxylate-specific signal transduction histidine kinase
MFKFENEHFERLLVEFQSLHFDLHQLSQVQFQIMATLQQVQDGQTAETQALTAQAQAITDLTARIAALPQGAASATDLDGLLATAQTNTTTATANTAAINAIDPAAAPTA